MDENSLVVSLHKFTGCSIAECHKALILAMRYLKLRHPIGDHPEEASKHEYELVPNDYIMKSEQWLKELTEYKQLNKPCVATQICHEDKVKVLDKIKSDIEEYKSTIDNAISEDELKIEGMKEAYTDCLEIIDKYRAETEQFGNPDRLREGE